MGSGVEQAMEVHSRPKVGTRRPTGYGKDGEQGGLGRRDTRRLGFSQEGTRQKIAERRTSASLRIEKFEQGGEVDTVEKIDKNKAVEEAIKSGLRKNFLFEDMEAEVLQMVVDAMFSQEFVKGDFILTQGSAPEKSDSLYFLEKGSVDILVKGTKMVVNDPDAEQSGEGFAITANGGDGSKLVKLEEEEEKSVAVKKPGETFGDVALLFACPRTASAVALEKCRVWLLPRKTFSQIMTKYSSGTRKLRFLRSVPLLQSLTDSTLREVADKMVEVRYEDGDTIISEGEDADTVYIVEIGFVSVMKKLSGSDKTIEMCRIAPLEFFGERGLMLNTKRSATCIASGPVTLFALKDVEFESVRQLLQHVIDDQMVFTVLREIPQLAEISESQLEQVIGEIHMKEFKAGDRVASKGSSAKELYIIKSGLVEGSEALEGETEPPHFPGYSSFGFGEVLREEKYSMDYTVASDKAECFCMSHAGFMKLVAPLARLQDSKVNLEILKAVPTMKLLSEKQLEGLLSEFYLETYDEGEEIIQEGEPGRKFYVLKEGQCEVTKLDEAGTPQHIMTLNTGDQFGERALLKDEPRGASVFASRDGTEVLTLTRLSFENRLGSLKDIMAEEVKRKEETSAVQALKYEDLDIYRVIGFGQFGKVHVVQHKYTRVVYAMKKMSKMRLCLLGQEEHVCNEEALLRAVDSPFCVRQMKSFQDDCYLYLMLEFVQGGELFRLLDMEGHFPNDRAKFYAANIVLALQALHEKGIVYRDLKPENILLDKNGYLKLTDLGFAKKVGFERTFTVCGTLDYHAPEVIKRAGHGLQVDFWSLGVLIYELLVGVTPFCGSGANDPEEVFPLVLSGEIEIPSFVHPAAADLLSKLLVREPSSRLGCGGINEIMKHPWFSDVDFERMANRLVTAPFQPYIENVLDVQNFDEFDWVQDPEIDPDMDDSQMPWANWDRLESEHDAL